MVVVEVTQKTRSPVDLQAGLGQLGVPPPILPLEYVFYPTFPQWELFPRTQS